MALEEYPPLTEAELDEWEARARGPKDWAADYVLHLIAEIRRLRRAQEAASAADQDDEAKQPSCLEERRARVMALAGKYADAHSSVDEFLRRKREEIGQEEERQKRQQRDRNR
jgi:hypothetical protein